MGKPKNSIERKDTFIKVRTTADKKISFEREPRTYIETSHGDYSSLL